jgi:hypothetical protein
LTRFEFEFGIVSYYFSFTFVSFGELRLLVSCVQVAGAAWCAATRTVAGVGDLVQRARDGRTGRVLGGRALERSGGVVCGLHLARGD